MAVTILNIYDAAITCTPWTAPANGAVDVVEITIGTMVKFTCEPLYTRNGPETVTCLPTGQWSPNTPTTCIRKLITGFFKMA